MGSLPSLIGYVLGAGMIVLGLLVLLGVLRPDTPPGQEGGALFTIFAVVMLLYGIYRIAITDGARRRRLREERRNERPE